LLALVAISLREVRGCCAQAAGSGSGLVRREDGARKYAPPYVLPVLVGVAALLVILTASGS
jgi:hypothetical protein